MSDELSEIVRAAARAEAAAAEREFPYSPAVLGRFVGPVRRRRAAGMATLAVAAVSVIALAALGLGQLRPTDPTVVSPLPAATASTSTDHSASPTPTVEPPTTLSPSPTPTPSSTPTTSNAPSTVAPPPTKTPTLSVPGPVTGVKAYTGGGSGETMINWDQGADATGYRVYRSDLPAGPFAESASLDVATGTATIAPAFANDYVIIGIYGEVVPGVLYYVDAIPPDGPTYYKVAAFNPAGEGPTSAVVCSTSPFFSTSTC